MKSITIAGGKRARIISRFSNSLQMTYRFNAEPVHEGDPVEGTVEVRGSNWIFPKPPVMQPLERQNEVEKGAWDTFYSVWVKPNRDVTITLDRKTMGPATLVMILIAMVVIAAAAVLFRSFLM